MGYRRSSVPNLYRDERTGIYYVRTKVHGRTIWKTLQTNEFRVAKLRAPKELGDLQNTAIKFTIQQYRRNTSRYFRGGLGEWTISGQSRTIDTQGARRREEP